MREAKTKTIGSTIYTVNQLGPTRALDVLFDLAKMLGPGLAPIVSNVSELSKLLDQDTEGMKLAFLGDAVRALCTGVDKEVSKAVIKTLASVTVIENKGALDKCYETHFATVGLAELFQWVAFALQTQYDDFFDVFGNAIKSVPRPAVKA